MTQKFTIQGMTCVSCAKICELRAKRIQGVMQATCHKETGVLEIETDRRIGMEELNAAFKETELVAGSEIQTA